VDEGRQSTPGEGAGFSEGAATNRQRVPRMTPPAEALGRPLEILGFGGRIRGDLWWRGMPPAWRARRRRPALAAMFAGRCGEDARGARVFSAGGARHDVGRHL